MKADLAMGRLTTTLICSRDGVEARALLRQAGHMYADAMVHMPTTHVCRLLLSPATETLLLFHVSPEGVLPVPR